MTIPTASELALLRTRPHSAQAFLSIYQPPVVFQALVTGSWGQGINAVPYYSVITGSYANIVGNMTMYVGTTPGGWDRGKIRVRSATASQLTVAENANIVWDANLYLTVVNFHESWPVFPRMVLNGSTTYWYKDYDIPYAGQNSVLGTLINMGPHHAGFVGTGTAGVFYSSSGTYSMLGQSLSFFWTFEGGNPAWYSGSVPGYVSYPTPGFYTTTLRVTDANGVVESSYRHVSIYDRPAQGTHIPIMRWGISSLDGSRGDGGWSAHVWSRDNLSAIVDGALCVFFVDVDYGGVQQGIGGNAPNRSSILMVGYIDGETIHYDWEKSYVEFDIFNITGVMKNQECFSVALNSVVTPSFWYELSDMDVRRAVYHYLRWHTTVLEIADVSFWNFVDLKINYFDADKASLYDAIASVVQSALLGQVVSDRQGKIWIEQEAGIIPNASGTVARSIDLTRQDWMGEPYFSYQGHDVISYVEMGGIAYSGAVTGTNTALLAGSPGAYVPRYGGSSQTLSGLALIDQNQLNVLAGDYLAWRGSRLSDVEFELTGDYRIFDIAPQEQLFVSLAAPDTIRGVVWNRKPFILQRMSGSYTPDQQVLLWSMSVHELTKGTPGSLIAIPPVPPDTWPTMSYSFPKISLPTLPSLVFPSPPSPITNTVFCMGAKALGAAAIPTLARTDNFLDASPNWREILPSSVSGTFIGYCHDPFYPGRSGYYVSEHAVYYLTNLDTLTPIATILKTLANCTSDYGTTVYNFLGICASVVIPGLIYVTMRANGSPSKVCAHRHGYLGSWHYIAVTGTDGEATWDTPMMVALTAGKVDSSLVYVGGVSSGGTNYRLMKSTDGGHTWSLVKAETAGGAAPAQALIPYELNGVTGSSADQGLWLLCMNDAGDTCKMYYSANRGASFADRTYLGKHAWGDGGGSVYGLAMALPYYSDKLDVVALVLQPTANRGKEAPHIISSKDGGITWTLQKTFTQAGGTIDGRERVRGLVRSPFDPNILYACGYGSPTDEDYMIYSIDRGLTWISKRGDWVTVFGHVPVSPTYSIFNFMFPVY